MRASKYMTKLFIPVVSKIEYPSYYIYIYIYFRTIQESYSSSNIVVNNLWPIIMTLVSRQKRDPKTNVKTVKKIKEPSRTEKRMSCLYIQVSFSEHRTKVNRSPATSIVTVENSTLRRSVSTSHRWPFYTEDGTVWRWAGHQLNTLPRRIPGPPGRGVNMWPFSFSSFSTETNVCSLAWSSTQSLLDVSPNRSPPYLHWNVNGIPKRQRSVISNVSEPNLQYTHTCVCTHNMTYV